MGLYEHWPYVNFHELNLNWILEEMRSMTERIENYVAELGIKYADPIDWNITSQYEQNTLVIEPESGTAYLSLQAVPSGISILNTDYWSPVFTLGELIRGIREGTAFAVEETNICTAPRAAGDLVWVDKTLVRCKQQILAGSAYNYGTGGNCEQISVEILLASLQSALDANTETISEHGTDITELQTLTAGHTNQIRTLDDEMTAAQSAILENAEDIQNIQGQIGSIIQQKKFLLVGDSYAEGYTPDGVVSGWAALFRDYMGLNANNCIITYRGGAGFVPSGNTFNDLLLAVGEDTAITDVIICGGWNDRTASADNIINAVTTCKNTINTLFPNAEIYIGCIGRSSIQQKYDIKGTITAYIRAAALNGIHYLNNVEYSLYAQYEMFSSDYIHPNLTGQQSIARSVSEAYLTGSANVKGQFVTPAITPSGSGSAFSSLSGLGETLDNGVVTIASNAMIEITVSGASQQANGHTFTEVGTFTSGYITGDGYHHVVFEANVIVQNAGNYYTVPCMFKIENKKLMFALCNTNDSHTNYASYGNIQKLQVQPFSATFQTLLS